jgi:hypothetical protein
LARGTKLSNTLFLKSLFAIFVTFYPVWGHAIWLCLI